MRVAPLLAKKLLGSAVDIAAATQTFDEEIRAYEACRLELEKTCPAQFVVFRKSELVGAWRTMDAAAGEAVRRFGGGQYLVLQVGVPQADGLSLLAIHVRR